VFVPGGGWGVWGGGPLPGVFPVPLTNPQGGFPPFGCVTFPIRPVGVWGGGGCGGQPCFFACSCERGTP